MDSTRAIALDRFSIWSTPFRLTLLLGLLAVPFTAAAQVRTKLPDRGLYQSPQVTHEGTLANKLRTNPLAKPRSQQGIAQRVRQAAAISPPKTRTKFELVEVPLEEQNGSPLQPVAHQDVILAEPGMPRVGLDIAPTREPRIDAPVIFGSGVVEQGVVAPRAFEQVSSFHDATCDGCSSCDGAGASVACDSMGCDSPNCNEPSCGFESQWTDAICMQSDRWFGGAELLLMWRKGDRLPPLVTTGPDSDPDTAGELGQPGTQLLAGNARVFSGLTAGGRFTLGKWLDDSQCQAIVGRFWFAGQDSSSFYSDQSETPVIARPFLNVSDNQAAAQDTLLIAFPNRASGEVSVLADSNVLGADLSVRQFMYGKFGGTIDLIYGYQYMRLNEGLAISSTSTSLVDGSPPLGSVISVNDSFDTKNEFHGGQLGIASRYREGCWSFDGMLKFGFGSLRRTATRTGSTFTSLGSDNATVPNGLLVRSTNSGKTSDGTFGWIPELDLSLGYQAFERFDFTLGYHIIAMTDSLRVSGSIDPALAVNLSDPPTGQQRPSSGLRYETFYVQGIHFGMQYVY